MSSTTTIRKSDRYTINGTLYRIAAVVDVTTMTFGTTRHADLVPVSGAGGQEMRVSVQRLRAMITSGEVVQLPKHTAL